MRLCVAGRVRGRSFQHGNGPAVAALFEQRPAALAQQYAPLPGFARQQ